MSRLRKLRDNGVIWIIVYEHTTVTCAARIFYNRRRFCNRADFWSDRSTQSFLQLNEVNDDLDRTQLTYLFGQLVDLHL